MKNHRYPVYFCLTICLLVLAILPLPGRAALDPKKDLNRFDVRKWDTANGLPGKSVYAILQSGSGYLWLGTSDGLVRFDGSDFMVFNKDNTSQFKDNTIRSLYQDSKGILYIGTENGGLISLRNGTFTCHSTTKHPFLVNIYAINQDRWKNLWIASFGKGLIRFNNKTGFTPFTTVNNLPHNKVRNIHKDHGGDLWVTTISGIIKITGPGRFQPVEPGHLPTYLTTCNYNNVSGTLWIGSGANGLIRLHKGTVTEFGTGAGLPDMTINCLYRDSRDNLWLGSDGGGLIRMRNGAFDTLPRDNEHAGTFIYAIREDREGSLWVGTLDHGLLQFRDTGFFTFTTTDGLLDDAVECVYQDSKGTVWIGTDGGLNRLDEKQFIPILTTAEGLRDNRVLALLEDTAGNLWIGTYTGLHRFANGNLTTITRKNGSHIDRVKCLMQDREGSLWIGTENGLYHRTPNGFITHFTTENNLSSNFIECLHQDSSGAIMIGTEKGLHRFQNGKLSPQPVHDGVDNSRFRCIYRDGSGTLWFGTDSGLVRFNNGKSYRYTINSGLKENYIYTILEDDANQLWLGGRSGVSRIEKKQLADLAKGKIKKLQPTVFDENDGMKSRWVAAQGFKTRDGRLWFPTNRGAAVVQPKRAEKKLRPPPVMIDTLVVDGETVDLAANISQVLELGPGKKRLEISYAGIGFNDPKRIIYQLKLDNYDHDWVDMGAARSTTYTNLSPGQYTFRVRAAYPGGKWTRKQAAFAFYLAPHFYQTLWFYLLMALSLPAAFILRIQQLKRRENQLKALVELRTLDLKERNIQLERAQENLHRSKELIEDKNRLLEAQSQQLQELDRAKSRFFTNISHEFRTPLTLIIGPLEQILSESPNTELKNKANLMMRNSRRLLTLVNQLLELSRLDSGKMKLETSLQDIVTFIRHTVSFFDSLAAKSNIAITRLTDDRPIPIYFDGEKLEKVITNLLSNAFNHTPPGGAITVTVRKTEPTGDYPFGSAEVSVRDTGSGIPPEQLPHIFDRFYRGPSTHDYKREGTGIGLALTKELVELHHGRIEVTSSTGDTATQGTRFVIMLPVGSDHLQPGETVEIPTAATGFWEGDGPVNVQEKETGTGKPTVLVVEDNADARDHIRQSLAPNFNIVDAADGGDGIKKAREIIPDLVISDVMMPGCDGYQLCRTLKNDIGTSHIPVILVTAKASESGTLEGLAAGADDYITKPFSTAVLTARAGNLMELRRQLHLEQSSRMALQPGEIKISPMDSDFYKTLQDTVEKHLSDPEFSVDTFSRELNMSHATLYRKINALTGGSPIQFIRSYRLKRAAQLLQEGTGNIAAIARKTGFPDPSYFARCFKEQFHRSPSDYLVRRNGTPEDTSETTPVPTQPETAAPEHEATGEKNYEKDVVLVVEDNNDARTYIRSALESDYRVVEAENGDIGISRAMETIPDLVVSDIMMPGSDGYQLCATLKKDLHTCHIPIILLTAKASDESIIRGLETGADDYITKPFNTFVLLARIKNLIRLRSHVQKKRRREMTLMPSDISQSELDNQFLKELNATMEKNLSDSDFNVEQLAKTLYMSSATLYRKVQALTGKIPSHYIRSYRLQAAARLLREKFGTITEIAFEVGFASRAYFARCFKEEFHMAPSDYKENFS